jgi:hypothetical protein
MQQLSNIPPAPREPSAAAQEALFQLRSTRLIWLVVGILWATLGWIVPYFFAQGIASDLLLSVWSQKSSGVITEVKESDGLPINRVYPQSIFYEYTVEGQSLKGLSKTFDDERAKQLKPGQSIELEVFSPYPSLSRVTDTNISQYGVMGFFTIGFPLLGFVLIGVVLGRRDRERRAYTHGTATIARCITSQKKGTQLWFRWEFEVDGRLRFGEIFTREHPALIALLPEKELAVLYNPSDPRDNCIYIA